jgi:putative membrane protein
MRMIARVAVNAAALAVAAQLLPGIRLAGDWLPTLIIVAVIFGLVNALLKPVVQLLTCPLVILTLGLFTLVINGLMLMVTAALSGGRLVVDGWVPAILGGIVMALVSMVLEWLLGLAAD